MVIRTKTSLWGGAVVLQPPLRGGEDGRFRSSDGSFGSSYLALSVTFRSSAVRGVNILLRRIIAWESPVSRFHLLSQKKQCSRAGDGHGECVVFRAEDAVGLRNFFDHNIPLID